MEKKKRNKIRNTLYQINRVIRIRCALEREREREREREKGYRLALNRMVVLFTRIAL